MSPWSKINLQGFLSSHPKMRLIDYCDESVVIEGDYFFNGKMDGDEAIQETYKIRITFPAGYPKDLPTVAELGRRIPRKLDYHTYPDGSFCLGSDIRLKSILYDHPTVFDFAIRVITPFLYKITYKLKYGSVPSGELDHGEIGLVDDYQRLFGIRGKSSVLQVLHALGKRKREANKLSCPCGCGNRLGECSYRFLLQQWRRLERRRWFRNHIREFTPINKKPRKEIEEFC